MLQRQVIFIQLNDGSYVLKVTFGGNKYFELNHSWGADGAPQTRTTCL